MPEAHVKGKISMDGRQAEQSIDSVVKRIKGFESAVKGAGKAFGAFMISRFLTRATMEAAEYSEEIVRLARKYELTTDQAQKLLGVANEMSMPVDELVEKWKNVGAEVGSTVDSVKEFNRYVGMSADEIDEMLQAQSALKESQRKISTWIGTAIAGWSNLFKTGKMFPGTPSQGPASNLQKNAEGGTKAFARIGYDMTIGPPIPKALREKSTAARIEGSNLNELQRIGAFTAQNPMVNLAKEQLAQLKRIERNTQADDDATGV
jgi:uncharacterized protein YoxC